MVLIVCSQDTFDKLRAAITAIPSLQIVGEPTACVLAVSARAPVSIYDVADNIEQRGWSVTRLQRPECIHFVFGQRQTPIIDQLIADLQWAAAEAERSARDAAVGAGKKAGGSGAIYGMAARLPDRSLVGEILTHYMDVLYELQQPRATHAHAHRPTAREELEAAVAAAVPTDQ